MRLRFLIIGGLLALGLHASAQSIFNCTAGNWQADGPCGAQEYGSDYAFNQNGGSVTVSGGNISLVPNPGGHVSSDLIYAYNYSTGATTPVNVQAFTSTFTFVPDGVNVAFVLQNTSNTPGTQGPSFAAGAGCEGGFFQHFTPPSPNNIFALELDSNSPLTNGGSFSYSTAQIYQSQQDPCLAPGPYGSDYATTKLSTSPVPLNSPSGTTNTTTGDTYSATISYDGTNLNLCLYDVTAATGSCSSGTSGTGTYFQKTWTAINIPSIVGGNTAYVGLSGGSNSNTVGVLWVYNFGYTVNTAPSNPTLSTYTTTTNGGSAGIEVTNPVFSPAAGSYSGTQSVTISNSTTSSYFCYILSSETPSIYPWPDSLGGCQIGTLYSGAISVSSTQTLYAVAGIDNDLSNSGPPSSQVSGTYTIGGVSSTNSGSLGARVSGGGIH